MAAPTKPVALVTGAGSGIGRATAINLAARGYRLAIVGRRSAALEESLAAADGGLAIVADLEDADQAALMVDKTLDHFGRLDALVNNAGWSPPATIPQTTPDLARRVFALNAVAPAVAIARAWPALERQARADARGGVIVNVSSMAALDPYPTLYAYAAAKAAVNSLARSAANLGRPLGIRAFAVAPGAVETDLLRTIVSAADLPADRCLAPAAVAAVITDCILGNRDHDNGNTIWLPSP